jgi:hypothetical protein
MVFYVRLCFCGFFAVYLFSLVLGSRPFLPYYIPQQKTLHRLRQSVRDKFFNFAQPFTQAVERHFYAISS